MHTDPVNRCDNFKSQIFTKREKRDRIGDVVLSVKKTIFKRKM